MNTTTLLVLCGLPGSGKSYQAELLAKEYNAHIHSSDQLRQELLGDITDQSNNDLVFKTLHKRIKDDLSNGISCVYDACSVTRKSRMNILREFAKIDCEKICIFVATPYHQCLKNNARRDRTIPENVIKRMYLKFDPPAKYEGFDDIEIIYWKNSKDSKYVTRFLTKSKKMSQDNHHHTYSIGRHCLEAGLYIYEHTDDKVLFDAALLHDEGKIFTKAFFNAKGEPTEEAHYFSHNNVGSYNSFFYAIPYADKEYHLYVAQLINWHMRPYLAWERSEKAKEKDKRLIGDKLFNDICLLHEADVNAH